MSPSTWHRGTDRDGRRLPGAALLLLVALAVVMMAAARAQAADCSLSIVQCLDVDFPAATSLGSTINAGSTVTSAEQLLHVSSTSSWGVRIQTDLVDGRMKQWNGSAYTASPWILSNPLMWGLTGISGVPQTPSYVALSSTPATVVSGRPAHCVLGLGVICGSSTIGVRHRLTTSFNDRRVSPNSYRTLVTYTVQHGF